MMMMMMVVVVGMTATFVMLFDDYVGVGDATDAFGCDVVDEGLAMPMAMATVSVVVVAM